MNPSEHASASLASEHDTIVALLAPLLSEQESSSLDDLKPVLAAGTSPRMALREMPPSSLRTRLEETPAIWDEVERARAWCELKGARLVFPGHRDYPTGFARLHSPPRVLNYIGKACWTGERGLAVVGSREPSRSALEWMDTQLPPALRRLGAFTVSGGARGVDQRAHALSLRAGAPTVAFLPAGLARVYPSDFVDWIDAIVDGGGALVTEFSPFEEMRKAHFHRRNRLIAAMSCACLVVEAGRKSGSMITARQAGEAGVPVAVLPASPMESRALGGLDLLFDGAQLLRDERDLVEFVELSPRPVGG